MNEEKFIKMLLKLSSEYSNSEYRSEGDTADFWGFTSFLERKLRQENE